MKQLLSTGMGEPLGISVSTGAGGGSHAVSIERRVAAAAKLLAVFPVIIIVVLLI
jgi:hypothetical protein